MLTIFNIQFYNQLIFLISQILQFYAFTKTVHIIELLIPFKKNIKWAYEHKFEKYNHLQKDKTWLNN